MKKAFLILGTAAAALAVSCTKSEELKTNEITYHDGEKAYVNVVISEVGSTATRAAGTEDGGYVNGSAEEYAVVDAMFYFYDHLGEYVTSASVWNGGNPTETGTSVEFEGNTVIVLDNLNGYTTPMYMITVLNPSDSFKPVDRLSDMLAALSDTGATDGGIYYKGSSSNFLTMSTSSYAEQTITPLSNDSSFSPYFVTEVKDENFHKEPVDTTANDFKAVTVYVERLAAKVQVDLASSLTAGAENVTVGESSYKMYPLRATIAGDSNEEDNNEDYEGAEDLYVNLIGWKLNATSKWSYMSKNIDEDWDLGSFEWNKASDSRCFWAKSPSYGWTGYPTSSNGYTEDDEEDNWSSYYLNYVDLADMDYDFDDNNVAYCAENTNTAAGDDGSGLIKNRNSSLLTAVLIKAQMYSVADGVGTPLANVVRYEGMLWTEARYIDYVLNNLNVYYQTSTEQEVTTTDPDTGDETTSTETVYTYYPIDAEYANASIKESDDGDSIMEVTIDNASGTYYTYVSETDKYETIDYSVVEERLASFNSYAKAVGYKDGLMYYSIPIEHLRKDTSTDEDGNDVIYEANYGVVRNHWYQITVNKLEGIGHGVSNPNEIVVPNDEDEDTATRYVGARINILSWKVVNQGVDL